MKIGFILKLAKKFGKMVTGAKKFFLKAGKLKKIKKAMKACQKQFKKVRNKIISYLKCNRFWGHPVDAVTGEVVVGQEDFTINGRIAITWTRYYGSHNEHIGVCGRGWETPADVRLEIEDNGKVIFQDGTGASIYFNYLPENKPIYDLIEGALLQNENGYYTVRIREDIIYFFPQVKEDVREIYVEYIKDMCGNSIQYIRDKNGLREIKESNGRCIHVNSTNGMIEKMFFSDSLNVSKILVRYEYDQNRNLVSIYDALNVPFQFEYRNNIIVKEINRNGMSFYYDYDLYSHEGRCMRSWGEDGLLDYKFVYRENLTEITDSLGNTTCLKYNDRYLITQEINPLGGMTFYEYDDAGRTIAVIDPDGNRTEYEYDRRGNLLKLTRPDGKSIITEYEENKPTRLIDPKGAIWLQEWDSHGLLIRKISPLGAESKYQYDNLGMPVSYVDPLGAVTKLNFDNYGNLESFIDALGHKTKFTSNIFGCITSKTDPLGKTTIYEYDLKGRLIKAQVSNGATITCAYDGEDNLVYYKDENGFETRLEYCGFGKLKRHIQPDGKIIEYHYDTEDRVTEIVNQNGERFKLNRDPLGRIISEVDYWGQEMKYSYTDAGHLKGSIDPLGQLIKYKTDPLGRIVEKLLPDSTKPETFSYDENGNLIACENSTIHVEWDYDLEGRILEERLGSEFFITSTYNLNGDCISKTTKTNFGGKVCSNTVYYCYDSLGQISTVEIEGYDPLQFTRNALGQITHEILSKSLKRTIDYSPYGFLSAQKVLNDNGSLFEQHYIYDSLGNLIQKKDTVFGTDLFSYDPLGRIVTHTNPEGIVKRYLADSLGDLLATKVTDNEANWSREGKFEGGFYRFDRAGNLKEHKGSNGEMYLKWDASNRLIESTVNGQITKYFYDPLGRRISKENDEIITKFYWDCDALLGDVIVKDTVNNYQRKWVYYPGTFIPLVMICESNLYFYHNEPNGCPTRLMDDNGKVVWASTYDAMGKSKSLTVNHIDNPIRMQGQYFDSETGLYYNRYRYLDPTICAFISQDPLGLEAGSNLYSYAPNVWGWIDPWGLTHKMIGEVFRNGESLDGPSTYSSGGLVGKNTYQSQLLTHTERQFLGQIEHAVQPGDVLEMKGVLNPCKPGCQPAIRSFVQNNQVTAIYKSSSTGLTYKWTPFNDPKLKGNVIQQVYKDGKLVSSHRYWQKKNGRWARAKFCPK